MPVIEYSTSADANTLISGISLAEGWPPQNVNNVIRQFMADISLELASAALLTATASISLGGMSYGVGMMTGSASIVHLGTARAGYRKWLHWPSASTLVNSANLICDGGANITTATNDVSYAISLGSGVYVLKHYPATGLPAGGPTALAGYVLTANGAGVPPTWQQSFLTANTTYYVRTDGSDANTGLVDSAGGGWLTLQHAWDVVSAIDLRGFVATVQIRDGTYTGPLTAQGFLKGQKTASSIIFQGNSGTPTNVVINATSPTSGATIAVTAGARLTLKDMRLRSTTTGQCLQVDVGAAVDFSGLDFGASAAAHISLGQQGFINIIGNYTISGAATVHWATLFPGSLLFVSGKTLTISGTPAFSTAFAVASQQSEISCASMTFTGSATGVRYSAVLNGIINTGAGGATYLPGNSAGSIATQGQYV